MKKLAKMTEDEITDLLAEVQSSSWDGKKRLVKDSDKIKADGETWGIVSDHGNVEFAYRGRNGRLYYLGGIV